MVNNLSWYRFEYNNHGTTVVALKMKRSKITSTNMKLDHVALK